MAGISEELERLAALLEKGLINRDEFDEEKRILRSGPRTTTGGGATHTSGIRRNTAPETGDSIGAYRILGELGVGGMGVVYRARHRIKAKAQQQGGDVAVKVLHAQYAQNTEYRERFEREAGLGMKLSHPGIIGVFDLIEDAGKLAIAMEMAEGRPMSEMIGKETGPIPWERAGPLFEQLLAAVEYAHSKGVIHRDIKPENIVVGTEARIKILDFGIAKDLEDGKTKTGTGMGTVDYMAPEQYTDASKVDQRADIYALGMTLYEMLAGRLPWPASTTEFKVLTLKSRGDFPPPTEYYPEIPEGVLAALSGALAVDLGQRYADVTTFRRALNMPAVQAKAERAIPQTPTNTTNQHCTRCGKKRTPDNDFCIGCGANMAELDSGAPACRNCRAQLGSNDAFCIKCGTRAAPAILNGSGCTHCRAPMPPGNDFCTSCGKSQH